MEGGGWEIGVRELWFALSVQLIVMPGLEEIRDFTLDAPPGSP